MTKAQAIQLHDSGWWKDVPLEEAARFQLFEPLLCMPFGVFHQGVEKLVGRPVFTHEFAFIHEPNGLQNEALGKAPARTLDEVMALIPVEKRIVLIVGK